MPCAWAALRTLRAIMPSGHVATPLSLELVWYIVVSTHLMSTFGLVLQGKPWL